MRLRIGEDNVLAVIDSGSQSLGVATTDCIQKRLCSARDAGYNPGKSLTANHMNRRGLLNYASLKIESDMVRDDVRLQVLKPELSDSRCLSPPSLEDSHALDEAEVSQMVVHAASAMHGTHSNVIGFMAPSGKCSSDPDDPCVLSVLFESLACSNRWGLACAMGGAGFLTIGTPPAGASCMKELSWVPFSTGFQYMGAYVVDIARFWVGPSVDALEELPRSKSPHFLIIDSGTADSYITSSLSRGFLEAGFPHTHDATPARDVS